MLNRRKVVFILPNSIGGAERMSINIANFLDKDTFDVKFVVMGKSLNPISNLIPSNYDIELIKIRNIWYFFTFRLIRLFRKEKPHVVFCSLMNLSVRVIIASKIVGGIKCIIRSDNYCNVLRKDQFWLCRATFRYADIIIAQQEDMRREIIKKLSINSDKIVTIHNPLDTKKIDLMVNTPNPYPSNNSVNYLWVARFDYWKGQDILIKSFLIVKKIVKNAHLYLVGGFDKNSKYYQEISSLIINNNLQNDIHVIGYDSNPYKWMKYCDCFVLPSRIEGLPNALIEAMYLKRPVVAARCIPIISNIIEQGYNGFLVEKEDYNNMANAMIKAITLKNFEMTYKPSTSLDFIKLFY